MAVRGKEREKRRRKKHASSGAELRPLGKGRPAFNHAIEVKTRLINTVLSAISAGAVVQTMRVLCNVTPMLQSAFLCTTDEQHSLSLVDTSYIVSVITDSRELERYHLSFLSSRDIESV